MGKMKETETGHVCGSWKLQTTYPANHFPDGNIKAAENYCRNPQPEDHKAWCYYRFTGGKKWNYCDLRQCGKYHSMIATMTDVKGSLRSFYFSIGQNTVVEGHMTWR